MKFKRGNTYNLPIDLLVNGEIIDIENIEEIEVSINKISKYYPDKITFKDNQIIVPLTQEETFKFPVGEETLPIEIRIKFLDGSVKGSEIEYYDVEDNLSKVIL